MRSSRLNDFGPYTIIRPIATGGMAEIYLARQRAFEGVERTVVLKRILERHAADVEFITMFLDEARLLATLSHPNIAQVFDVGKIEGTYYLAMEYVRGPTLGHLLAATKATDTLIPHKEAIGIALSIAEALHYVHERRDDVGRPLDIVHRDLNPANVMVSYDGAVKLIDFGIAKAATKVYETRVGVIKGTYGYIAPEQLVGTTRVDRRADVFAMGILLYEMCVGHHPYDVSDEPNLVDRILEARYRRPRDVRPSIPRDLDRLIASCLTPHPEGRPDDMGELIDALARHLGEQGLVPTLSNLARLTRRLVPDDEGPRPLRPLTMPKYRRPFGQDPSGTRKLPLGGNERDSRPAPEPAPEPPRRRSAPAWTSSPIDDDEPLTIAERPIGDPMGTDAMIGAADMDDVATLARPMHDFPAVGNEDEALTKLVPLGQASAAAKQAAARKRPGQTTPTSFTPPPAGGGTSPLVVVGLALSTIAALLLLGFGVSRFIDAGEENLMVPVPGDKLVDATAEVPADIELRVVSEPPGATVTVDSEEWEGVTPLSVSLPRATRNVWLRLSLEGYLAQEREVSASVGEARFVLAPDVIEEDAGPADAGIEDAGGVGEDAGPARRWRRRRRGRWRRGR